jgi:hypothetical protein
MFAEDYLQKSWRWLSFVGLAVILLAAGAFIFATLPPRTIVMATGAEGGANYELGIRYRGILAQSGVKLQLLPTAGSLENLARLRDPKSGVGVGFIQGAPPTRRNRRAWSHSAPCLMSHCGPSAEVRLVKVSRRCVADAFRLVPREAAGER